MNHHNKRDIQSLKSKIAEIRHYNKSLFIALVQLFKVDTKDIYITLTESTITISHNFEYTKYSLKPLLKISNTHYSKASIVLCNKITINTHTHKTMANWQEMAKNNEYIPEFMEIPGHQEYKTIITLENLTFDITSDFITNLRRYFLSYDKNETYNIYITYNIPEINKSDIIKSHIDPIKYDNAYYKFHYSVYSDDKQPYIKCHHTNIISTIREKQTKHYKSYFMDKHINVVDENSFINNHIYDIKISLLNDLLLEEDNEIYGHWRTRKGVYFYKNGILLNTDPIECCLSDYSGQLQGRGVRISIDIIGELDTEFGIKSVKQVYQETYNQLNHILKLPIAFACYTAHMKYENISKNTKQITLDDVRELTEITVNIMNDSNKNKSALSTLRCSSIYNKIDGETDVKLDLDYSKEDKKKPDRQKKLFKQLNMLKYAELPPDVLDTFEEIIGIYGL